MEGSERQGSLELSYMEAVSGKGTLKLLKFIGV